MLKKKPSKKMEKGKKDFRSKPRYKKKKPFCTFCKNKVPIDYKSVECLRTHITASGKIMSRRITGVCSKHQRALCNAIKRARVMALLPFTRGR